MESKQTIENIRNAEAAYRSIGHNARNTIESTETFIKWHTTAAIAFSHIKESESKPFFDKFMSIDRAANGSTLSSYFNAINAEYEILMDIISREPK